MQSGHEIGNHTVRHPCTGNLEWSRNNALENYSTGQMKTELLEASNLIEKLLSVKPTTFAYPCGQTFIGRGTEAQSYISIVAEMFTTGRTKVNEGANDPLFCDFANLLAIDCDGKDFEQILPLIESAKTKNQWIILADCVVLNGIFNEQLHGKRNNLIIQFIFINTDIYLHFIHKPDINQEDVRFKEANLRA